MKPKQAKAICETQVQADPDCPFTNPVNDTFEFGFKNGTPYWKCLRMTIEAIEKAGFKVSITKDGKEYNR